MRVLVAEDNAINRRVTVKLLKKAGYRVDVVANGQEALEAIAKADYAAVLMDCQMPLINGFAVTRSLREGEKASGRHLPILAMTAYATSRDRERCLEAGMDDYLIKPIDP